MMKMYADTETKPQDISATEHMARAVYFARLALCAPDTVIRLELQALADKHTRLAEAAQ